MPEAVLELTRLTKVFGGLRAIDDVTLSVPAGQIFGLIGPNGAGKTTVFNVITGVYRPDSGSVVFRGRSIRGLLPHRIAALGIARTFQNIRLFSSMTVLENVMVAGHFRRHIGLFETLLRTRGHARHEAEMTRRALELLEIFELRELAPEISGSLPYGAQRRLEIVRALMLDPTLLLLDEPAAGMNSREADQLTDQIRWLRDRFELTILLVEHNMKVVMRACEHVHCMDHGETIAFGTPEVVQNDHAVRAAYLGEDEADEAEVAPP